MSIIFLNSALAPLLLFAFLPLLLHLLARTRPPVYEFSSNRFLEIIIKRTKRVRKPQDILLLIIRTLLFISIILMFLQPLFFSNEKLSGFAKRKNVVILVDASASMGYLEGGRTRFSAACAEASEILRTLATHDTANIIFIKSRPEALFPTTGSNIAYLRKKLRNARVSNEAGNVESAISKAVKMLTQSNDALNEICIISDFQRTQWQNQNQKRIKLNIPENVAVTLLKTGEKNGHNIGITRISSSPLLPLSSETVSFHCEVSNFSSSAARVPVYFHFGELHDTSTLLVPSNGSATATFTINRVGGTTESAPARKPGVYSFEFSIPRDALSEDNTRSGLLKIAESVKTAFTGTSKYPGEAWRNALLVFPWISCESVRLEDILIDDNYDFIFISGWNGEDVEKIRGLLKNGATIICAPKAGMKMDVIRELRDSNSKTGITSEKLIQESAPADKPFTLKIAKKNDSLFSIFAKGEYGDPVAAVINKRLEINSNVCGGGDPVISYYDGTTALFRCDVNTPGEFYLWNITLNPQFSNFASRIQFVPLMAEFILSRRKLTDLEHLAEYAPGDSLVRKIDFTGSLKEISLLSPSNKTTTLKIKPPRSENARNGDRLLLLVSDPVTETGIYSWKYAGKPVWFNSVNPVASESDLRSIPESLLKLHGTAGIAGTGLINDLHKGVPLWPWLLGLALILALSESLVMFSADREVKS